MTATTQAPPAEGAKKQEPKDYRLRQTVKIDLTDPAKVAAQLKEIAGDGNKLTVDVHVGNAKGKTPRDAINQFGSNNDLAGDYEVTADRSVTTFKGVSTAAKRTVSIG